MIRTLTAALAMLLTAAAALAAGDGPLNKRLVAADATWLFHLDLETLRASTCGAVLEDPEWEQGLAPHEREQLSRIRPVLRKLTSVTLYGRADPEDAVILLRTTATADEFFAAMKCDESMPEIVELPVEAGGYTLRSWRIEDETVYGFATAQEPGAPLVLLSSNRDNLIAAIDTAAGKKPALAGSGGQLDAAATPHPGAALILAASNLDALRRDGRASVFLENARALRLEIGEHDGQAFATAALTTASDQSALQFAEMARGLLAMGKFSLAQDEEHKPLCDLLEALAVNAEGATVSLSISYDAQELMKAYRETRDSARTREKAPDAIPPSSADPARENARPKTEPSRR